MITRRAAREIAGRAQSQETYYVGRIDRKIRHAADDGRTSTEVKFFNRLSEELAQQLLAITIEHGFTATLVVNDTGEHSLAINWETHEQLVRRPDDQVG